MRHQDTGLTIICYFERVVDILIICMDRGLALSLNVSLVIQIWRGLPQLNIVMYRSFLHIEQ